jgi:hypothetical protein
MSSNPLIIDEYALAQQERLQRKRLQEAQDEVQVLYNKIQYDRTASPEQSESRRIRLAEAEAILNQLNYDNHARQSS